MQHAIDDTNEKSTAIIEDLGEEVEDLSEDGISDVHESEGNNATEDDDEQDDTHEVIEKRRFIKIKYKFLLNFNLNCFYLLYSVFLEVKYLFLQKTTPTH